LAELASPKLETRTAESEGGRYIFCATVLQVALTGGYPAHCPAEFGLSSHLAAGGRLARCEGSIVYRATRARAIGESTQRAQRTQRKARVFLCVLGVLGVESAV